MAPSSGETGQKAFSPLSASRRWLPAYPGEAPHRTRSAGNLALAYQSPELRKIRPLSHPILDNLLQPPDWLRQPGRGSPEACPSRPLGQAAFKQLPQPASQNPAPRHWTLAFLHPSLHSPCCSPGAHVFTPVHVCTPAQPSRTDVGSDVYLKSPPLL